MPKLIDLTGQKFERLTVIERIGRFSNKTLWKCLCSCGKITTPNSYDLRSGKTLSCGCFHKEKVKNQASSGIYGWKKKNDYRKVHGMTKHKLYYIYRGIHDRCYREKCKDFKFYGAKGIKLCEEWKKDFMKFYQWSMDSGWKEGLTIDRIKNTGDYEPSNCQWSTRSENSRRQGKSFNSSRASP
jgi:hypothetical protein